MIFSPPLNELDKREHKNGDIQDMSPFFQRRAGRERWNQGNISNYFFTSESRQRKEHASCALRPEITASLSRRSGW